MGAKVTDEQLEAAFKASIRREIEELYDKKFTYELLYERTHDDVYKRAVWRIEQKIKVLEELL
jgi:hypothetical protein